jgi:archaemetzincin
MTCLPRIGVLPMGTVPKMVPKVIAAHVTAFFGLPAEVLISRPAPSFAFDPGRLQYDVGPILKAMEAQPFAGYAKIIAVVDVDLFVPVFTYVLGEARIGGRCALVSLFRLAENTHPGQEGQSRFFERCAKVALHELGHLFNLTHCSNSPCVMSLSGSPEDLDSVGWRLCRYCSLFLQESVVRMAL